MILTVAQVAGAARSSPLHVTTNWPLLCDALAALGADDGLTEVGLAAIVAVETAYTFQPINEYASGAAYDTGPAARRLGNTPARDGDGEKYKGRGFIQITGHDNYAHYGNQVDVDLLATPEKALDPAIAAHIAALYFTTPRLIQGVRTTCAERCRAEDWPGVRRGVNGGLTDYAEFKAIVDVLLTHLP